MLFATVAVAALVACAGDGKPRPIAYDQTNCAYCHMTIADRRFGAQFVSTKGKVHSFDSIECLAAYFVQHREDARAAWVTDFANPGTILRADTARFVRGGASRSPMALGLAAFGTSAAAAEAAAHGGEAMTWSEVLALVARSDGFTHTATHGASGEDDASH